MSGGLSVSSGDSALLDGASDIDNPSGDLDIGSFGDQSGVLVSAGQTQSIGISFVDETNGLTTGTVDLAINPDGSYQLSNLNITGLGAGESASGDFFYTVADGAGGVSAEQQATPILTIDGGSTLDVDLSAGPFLSNTFAVEGYSETGERLFVYEAGALIESSNGISLNSVIADVDLRDGLSLPAQAGGPTGLPPGLANNATGITTGFQLQINNYSGDILLRVTDASGDTAEHMDEASGSTVPLDVDLRAIASIDGASAGGVSVTPFSEAAITLAETGSGKTIEFNALDPAAITNVRALYASAAGIVDELVGHNPQNQRARPVNLELPPQALGQEQTANQYGLKLAALSQTDSSVSAGLAALIGGVSVAANGNQLQVTDRAALINAKVDLTNSLNDYLNQAGAAEKPTAAGGEFEVLDQEAPLQTSVTVNTLSTNNKTPTLTGTVNLTDNLNEADTTETLDFYLIINDVVYEYVDGSGDIDVTNPTGSGDWSLDLSAAGASPLADGTYSITAVLVDGAENATADGSVDELVIDATPPTVSLEPAQYIFLGSEGATDVVIRISEDVSDVAAEDLDLSGGVSAMTLGGNVVAEEWWWRR